jgi:hypothetical protein
MNRVHLHRLFAGLVPILLVACSRGETIDAGALLTSHACAPPTGLPLRATVESIVSRPLEFDGKFVSLTGHYCSRFELSGLFPGPDCYSDPGLGLWLSGVSPFLDSRGAEVTVVGRFDASMKGHLSQWPGEICVSRFEFKR